MKARELNKGDVAVHGGDGEPLTFIKMDGMYAQWEDVHGELVVGHSDNYTKQPDGTYIG